MFPLLLASSLLLQNAVSGSPTSAEWNSLNRTLEGNLLHVHPPAAPCHQATYDSEACAAVKQNWNTSSWRAEQTGAAQWPIWEQANGHWCAIGDLNSTTPISAACAQGSVPNYGVNASTVEFVQQAVDFARTHDLHIAVKGRGHDLLGRSTPAGSFLIWTHYIQELSVSSTNICGSTFETVTVGAGVNWGDVYIALNAAGRVVPGGGDPDVGASGGQVMGGGHSPLSNTYGLTTDSIISFKVVTMDGKARTVSACENSDLFWALRGGGGGTYAIVTSTTFQTYADGPIFFGEFEGEATAEGYANFFSQMALASPSLAESGWTGYFYDEGPILFGVFFFPLIGNRTADSANATFQSFVKSIAGQEGVALAVNEAVVAPNFLALQQGVLTASATGVDVIYGSRLIPKALLEDKKSRQLVVDTISSVRNNASLMLGHLVAGGPPVSKPSNSAILPAWRTANLHMLVLTLVPENSTAQQIQAQAQFVTRDLIEPLRKITPGGGAYMNEADAFTPTWKEDYFGSNYDRLLEIKLKYDPSLLLRCNRCVGSDL